jgi:hypothetical protein
MKQKYYSGKWLKVCFPFVLITLVNVSSFAQGTDVSIKINSENVINSINSDNFNAFDQVASKLIAERSQFISELLGILKNAKSSNYQQCAAAFYLGKIRAAQAADALAANIKLSMDHAVDHATILMTDPAIQALVEIGNPSIPAVIRNLAESDDAQVRDLSLKVLYRIEGDKDIVHLRLQKALDAQSNSTKKARVQSAMKALAAM